jgi:ABC-type lipoprotein release transport system permease subunit
MGIPLKYNVRNLRTRRATTLATAGGVALVVAVTMLLLALISGLKHTLVSTGHPDNLVVMRKGATNDGSSSVPRDTVQVLVDLPGIEHDSHGVPVASPELVVQPFFVTRSGGRENVLLRGVTPEAFAVHDGVTIVEGRRFSASLGEAIVGAAIVRRYGVEVGSEIELGRRHWRVVGAFSSGGSAFESEIWVDVSDLFTDAYRSTYSAVRLRVATGGDRDALVQRIADDPRVSLEAKPEVSYYTEQSESASSLYVLTSILAAIMSLGAIFGSMNTMFAAVAHRTAEIGTLRALGFSRRSILSSFVVESLLIALVGGTIGLAAGGLAVLAVNHLTGGVAFGLITFSTASVALRVSPEILTTAALLALAMGLFGGLIPARRAALLPVVEALRKA